MTDVEVPRAHEPMAPNETVGNTSPKKRKVEEDGDDKLRKIPAPTVAKKPRQEEASVSPPKQPSSIAGSSTPLIQLKGRKLVLKQDAFKISPPSRRVLAFDAFILDIQEAGKQVTEIPEEYWGLVAMLGHESTSRTEAALAKQIKTAMTGRVVDKDTLSTEALTPLISKVFSQNDCGFLVSDFSPSSSTSKLPAALQLRYWEVVEPERYFSGDQLATVLSRVEERKRARAECVRLLDNMDDIEKLELLKGDKDKGDKPEKKTTKPENDKKGKAATDGAEPIEVDRNDAGPSSWPSESSAALPRSVREGTANTVDSTRSTRSVSPTNKAKMTPEEVEAARVRKEEKEARKIERAEKKAAEEEAAERKKQANAKQAQFFGSFFGKKSAAPKVSPARPVAGPSGTASPVPLATETKASPSRPTMSDYEKTFKPVQKRPNVEWAPINRWRDARPASTDGASEGSFEPSWSAKDYVGDHLKTHGHAFGPPPRASLPAGLKSAPLFGTVADVWQSVEDAEDPRKVLAVLKNRARFPWKVLAFDEDVRPPYCGTFAKKSIAVGGRTPFAQDPALDYGYDSAEDWVDDEGGEDVDDFGEAAAGSGDEEPEAEADEEDEFDDWLDDSEDVGFARPGDGSSEGSPEPVAVVEQSKLPQQVVKSRAVPKKVVKLKPFIRGPMWEESIGEGSSGMQEYRLQLLNDTPDTIDPFTYTSSDPAQGFKTNFSSIVIGTNLAVKCLLSADPTTIRPPVPPFDAPPIPSPSADPEPKPSTSRGAPKVAFPQSHLADLLGCIEGSTKIRTDLVSYLRGKFEGVASKVAIEAKLKEVAVRIGKTKDSQWKVHPEAWIAAGSPVPASTLEPQKRPILPLPLPGKSPFMKDEYTVDLPRPMEVNSSSF